MTFLTKSNQLDCGSHVDFTPAPLTQETWYEHMRRLTD